MIKKKNKKREKNYRLGHIIFILKISRHFYILFIILKEMRKNMISK